MVSLLLLVKRRHLSYRRKTLLKKQSLTQYQRSGPNNDSLKEPVLTTTALELERMRELDDLYRMPLLLRAGHVNASNYNYTNLELPR